jgi:DNA-binding IclR family transcriptional regulator
MEQCSIIMRIVKSQLSHALGALEALADAGRGARLTDVAAMLEAPKSSVQRLLHQLAEEGWVEQDGATGRYRLTFRVAALGQRHLQAVGIADATGAILDSVARATRELVRLTVVDGNHLVWIGSAQGAPPGLMYQPAMGGRIVSYATANGKAWLATLPWRDAERIARADGIGGALAHDVGPRALTSMTALKRALADVTARGFAIADEEGERGVVAVAVAVRDRDGRTLGTTSVAGPVVRMLPDKRDAIAARLSEAARALAALWPSRAREVEAAQ